MVNIKVIHKKAVRRFTLPPNATWIELEAKLRTLFTIPALSPFTLSYTDEDNDVITLSTDLELKEIFSSAPTVKFDLKFSTSDDSSDSEDSGNEVWVLEGRNILPSKEAASATTDISGLQGNVSQKNIVSSTNQELQEPQFIEIDSRDLTETETSNKGIQADENLEKEDKKEKVHQVNILDDEFFDSLTKPTKEIEANEIEANETIETIETIETVETIESTPSEQDPIESTHSEQDQSRQDSAIDLQQFQMMIEQNQDAIKEDSQLIASIKDIMDQIRQLDSFCEPIMKPHKRFLNRPITPPGCTSHTLNVLSTSELRSLTPPPIPGAFPVPWAAKPPENQKNGCGRSRGGRGRGGRGGRGRRLHGKHHRQDDNHSDREQKEKTLDEEEASETGDILGTNALYNEKYYILISMGFGAEAVTTELGNNVDQDIDDIIERILSSN